MWKPGQWGFQDIHFEGQRFLKAMLSCGGHRVQVCAARFHHQYRLKERQWQSLSCHQEGDNVVLLVGQN